MALLATDSEVLWLNIMNGALGVVVLICVIAVAGAIVYEFSARARRRSAAMQEAARDFHTMVGTAEDHAFPIAGLGLTMADGGERVDASHKQKAK